MKLVEEEDDDKIRQMVLGEYAKARGRLYGDPRQTPEYRLKSIMEWLLQFIQTDLGNLSSGDWSNLKWDIECFSIMGNSFELGIDYSKNEISEVGLDDIWNWPDEADPTSSEFSGYVPSKNTVIHIQKIVLTHVKNLLNNNETTFSIPELKITIHKGSRKHLDIVIKSTRAKTSLIIFEYYLSIMLTKFALRIIECPECKIIFLSNRKDQRFCSTRCQSRLTMRKIRNTPPERMNKRGRPKQVNGNGGLNHGKKKQ